MNPSRTLRLRRDVLAELTTDEMRTVAGGSHLGCPTHGNTSCDACPTVPLNVCIDIDVVATLSVCIVDTLLCPTTPQVL